MFAPTFEQYQPIGNRLLLQVVGTDKSGEIWLPKTIKERWMPIAKLGTIVHEFEEGDMVLIGNPNMPMEKLTFGSKEYIQVIIHDVVGWV